MAHYAFIDSNNIVVEVIVGRDPEELADGVTDWEKHYEEFRDGLICKRTSYNTYANKHRNGGEPFRGNYAGVGFTWDESCGPDGAFIPPKLFPSWVFNESICQWEPPVPMPNNDKPYRWSEDSNQWEEIKSNPLNEGE